MKFLITIIFIFIFNINYALSDSLYDALKITYKNNKELNAERENVESLKLFDTIFTNICNILQKINKMYKFNLICIKYCVHELPYVGKKYRKSSK